MFNIGLLLYSEEGKEHSQQEGIKYILKAAEIGYTRAKEYLMVNSLSQKRDNYATFNDLN